jgi:hypothetical protein
MPIPTVPTRRCPMRLGGYQCIDLLSCFLRHGSGDLHRQERHPPCPRPESGPLGGHHFVDYLEPDQARVVPDHGLRDDLQQEVVLNPNLYQAKKWILMIWSPAAETSGPLLPIANLLDLFPCQWCRQQGMEWSALKPLFWLAAGRTVWFQCHIRGIDLDQGAMIVPGNRHV